MPMSYAGPSPGLGRKLAPLEYNAILLAIEILIVLGFGYLSLIGFASLVSYRTMSNYMLALIPLAILIPIVLIMCNSPGIYENGVKISRPLLMRLLGKKVFYRYEEARAFYPAEYVTSAQMMEPRGSGYGHYHRPGAINVGSFGQAYGAMLTDSGSRTGIGMATDDGEFVLQPVGPSGGQGMEIIRWAMGVRNLPMVRVPLQMSALEREALEVDTHGLSFKWYAIVCALALGIPFIPLIIGYAWAIVTGSRSLDVVIMMILAVIIGTAVFVGAYGYSDYKRTKARNRLSYYYVSQSYMIPEYSG